MLLLPLDLVALNSAYLLSFSQADPSRVAYWPVEAPNRSNGGRSSIPRSGHEIEHVRINSMCGLKRNKK